MRNWPIPQSVAAFLLGFSRYYRKFIPGYASMAAPLVYDRETQTIYVDAGDRLCVKHHAVLSYTYPQFSLEFRLKTDASFEALRAQEQDGACRTTHWVCKQTTDEG